ncbi:DUF742 domain-containing protein [Kitasatospora sp. MAP5-34]|uniref:DUF742 domain-containing protein n=1 Tax=Kitasatospora sp. MAP5-34 TaxID=3035102 RepID=UPI00247647B4|nr:DUF742 domain-containing protein [Kitasatospora sp. MAP5-34]MDH6578845.1 hypothetical protein [Kitasatospora sp. MAP5-34]
MSGTDHEWDEGNPERLYVITRGRSGLAERTVLDLVTLIVSRSKPQPTMQPEHAAILRLCHSPLSVAEISAYLRLPMSVTTVLLADLLADKRVEARAPVPLAQLPDRALIEAVMHGLQKL